MLDLLKKLFSKNTVTETAKDTALPVSESTVESKPKTATKTTTDKKPVAAKKTAAKKTTSKPRKPKV